MENYTLNVESRSIFGQRVRALRQSGIVPAIVYGGKQPPAAVQIEAGELDRLLARGGASHLVILEDKGVPVARVLIRDVQRHPVRRTLLHADFVRIEVGAKIRVPVPLIPVGTPPVSAQGAILLQNANMIEIECMPENVPAQIEVDVSVLKTFSQNISAGELKLPPGVTLTSINPDEVLFATAVPRGLVEADEEAAEDVGVEPEVITERAREDDSDEDF